MYMDRRDFVKGLAAMFAVAAAPSITSGVGSVAAAPSIISGVGVTMTNQLTIIKWERVRVHTSFADMFRMVGEFKYPPHLDPDAKQVYFAVMFDDYALQNTPLLKRMVSQWQKELERSVHDNYDTNCVFNYPSEFNYMDRVLDNRTANRV